MIIPSIPLRKKRVGWDSLAKENRDIDDIRKRAPNDPYNLNKS